MSKLQRLLKRKNRNLKRRIAQSMHDAGRANPKCRGMQRKLARLNRLRRMLRGV
jgi:hypothetical protein